MEGQKLIESVDFLQAGYCTHPERIVIQGGELRSAKFPAGFVLIRHRRFGYILFDTGYAERFYAETAKFPFSLYAKLTPVHLAPGESARKVLQERGIAADSIRYIIISHFHADHIGGLKDFPSAKFIYSAAGYTHVKGKTGFAALKNAYLAGLLPAGFAERSFGLTDGMKVSVAARLAPFTDGYDVCGDGSIILVELPGHAAGHFGALLSGPADNRYFLIADAAWQSKAYRELKPPSRIAGLVMYDRQAYRETLHKLHQLYLHNSRIRIVPAHCPETPEGVEKWIT